MKTWTYFYIEHTIKNGEVFRKESGWAISATITNMINGDI